jgi:hypothetical protein
MAKKPRTTAKKQPNCADWDIWSGLAYGWIDESDEEKKQQWEICGDWMMREWMQSRERPGIRPAGWWAFSAIERPKFLYWGKVKFQPELIGTGRHYSYVEVPEGTEGADRVFESEADCLARLGLLENWERDQLLEWEMLRGQPDVDED